jgi:predicted nucleic acid-binding Zn ribbon protein
MRRCLGEDIVKCPKCRAAVPETTHACPICSAELLPGYRRRRRNSMAGIISNAIVAGWIFGFYFLLWSESHPERMVLVYLAVAALAAVTVFHVFNLRSARRALSELEAAASVRR